LEQIFGVGKMTPTLVEKMKENGSIFWLIFLFCFFVPEEENGISILKKKMVEIFKKVSQDFCFNIMA